MVSYDTPAIHCYIKGLFTCYWTLLLIKPTGNWEMMRNKPIAINDYSSYTLCRQLQYIFLKTQYWPWCFSHICYCFGLHDSEVSYCFPKLHSTQFILAKIGSSTILIRSLCCLIMWSIKLLLDCVHSSRSSWRHSDNNINQHDKPHHRQLVRRLLQTRPVTFVSGPLDRDPQPSVSAVE